MPIMFSYVFLVRIFIIHNDNGGGGGCSDDEHGCMTMTTASTKTQVHSPKRPLHQCPAIQRNSPNKQI